MDLVSRELQVLIEATLVTFDVPPGCPVLLNDEQVKLRLLQPQDRVTLFYLQGPDGLRTARRVEAQPGDASVADR